MLDRDGTVTCGRWESDATVAAVGSLRDRVCDFALQHGMLTAGRHRLDLAVSEAVADAVGRADELPDGCGVRVDAATDGAWLTLIVTGDAPVANGSLQPWLPLVCTLAERVEWGPARTGGTRLLMEFAMGRSERGGPDRRCAPRRGRPGRSGRPDRARRRRPDA